jgi:hypothetical protein
MIIVKAALGSICVSSWNSFPGVREKPVVAVVRTKKFSPGTELRHPRDPARTIRENPAFALDQSRGILRGQVSPHQMSAFSDFTGGRSLGEAVAFRPEPAVSMNSAAQDLAKEGALPIPKKWQKLHCGSQPPLRQ